MNILIVGGGGREHALAWKASVCNGVQSVYVAPGNAGTERANGMENVAIAADDINALLDFALQQNIALTIVGPEVPLVAGIVDQFQEAGLRIFGPTAKAAQLEGSKSFCKDFLKRHNIPTADYEVFSNVTLAKKYIQTHSLPIVIKADGLAAGKGVVIAQTKEEASDTVEQMLSANRFGDAGSTVVIEEFLTGEELSYICMVDGSNILPLATSQDHKARDEGDTGPNTGGMGAYSPANGDTPSLQQHVIEQIIQPTVQGMNSDGNRFCGFLYAGLMLSADGSAKVLEYNVRFGDPETQPILMRLESDLIALCNAAIDGRLKQEQASWSPKTAIGVVMAAAGYPERYDSGDIINGLGNVPSQVQVFHAGTATDSSNNTITNGGRVLCVTALGEDIAQARASAYEAVDTISWDGMYCRRDIGHRAL